MVSTSSESYKLQDLLNRYGESHQNHTNQIIHKICVPLILWSLLGLLYEVFSGLDVVAAVLIFFYYLQFRNSKLLFGMAMMVFPILIVFRFNVPHQLWIFIGIFIVAWIGQFIGHKIEGKKPSFFVDIFFLLIGPLWVLKYFIRLEYSQKK